MRQRLARYRFSSTWLSLGVALSLSACAGVSTTPGGFPFSVHFSVNESPQAAALRVAPRIALVIGNNAYRGEFPQLTTSRQDAQSIATVLRQSGFQIVGGDAQLDVTRERSAQLVAETEQAIRRNPGAVVLVYFSGHGYALHGHNYLAPVNLGSDLVDDPTNSESGSIIGLAQRLSAAGSGLNIMFIDACRNAQFGEAGGLTDEKTPEDTFIGFATTFGAVALEPGGGTNSYYTAALLKVWNRNFDRLEDMHTAASVETLQNTSGRQTPVYREGKLPVVPVRLASTDPQSVFARFNGDSAEPLSSESVGQLDARCAAMGDNIRILASLVAPPPSGRMQITTGPRGQAFDLQSAQSACAAALKAGSRSPATLRGAAIIDMFFGGGSGFSEGRRAQDAVLLAQAAEQGDASAEFLLAILNQAGVLSDPSADKQALVGDRFARIEQSSLPMVSSMLALIQLNLEGQNQRLQEYTSLNTKPREAMAILHREAELGDQTALVELFLLYVERPAFRSSIDGPWLRNCIRRAISQGGSPIGLELAGLTPYQSLCLVAIFDYLGSALAPLNVEEFTEVLFPTEPFFGKLDNAFGTIISNFNFVGYIGCKIVLGLEADGRPASGGVPHREENLRFLEAVAPRGDPKAQEIVMALRRGFPQVTCPVDRFYPLVKPTASSARVVTPTTEPPPFANPPTPRGQKISAVRLSRGSIT
jgi:hypothetical protein